MAANLSSLNRNGVRIYLRQRLPSGQVVNMVDAQPHGALCHRDAVGEVEEVLQLAPLRVKITAHGLETNDWIVITQCFGVYEANGLHQVTVVDADTVELDVDGTGEFLPASGDREVFKCVDGLNDFAFSYVSTNMFYAGIGPQFDYPSGSKFTLIIWDVGPYAGDYFRKFELTGT